MSGDEEFMKKTDTPRVIGVIGAARHGKNLVSEYFVQYMGYTHMSFADPLKQLAEALINNIDNINFVSLARSLFVNTEDAIHIDNDLLKLKQIIKHMHLTPDMDPEDKKKRYLWQQMGTEIFRAFDPNIWVTSMAMRSEYLDKIVISDVRFPNEIDWIHCQDGIIYKVERVDGHNINSSHISEYAWRSAKPDFTVRWMNGFKGNGDQVPSEAIEQLYSAIKDTIEQWPSSSQKS